MPQVKVSQWDDSLGVRIPTPIARSLNIQEGDTLELSSTNEGLLLTKTLPQKKRRKLADVIDCFATTADYPEVDFGPAQGEEIW